MCAQRRTSAPNGHDDLPTSELLDPPLATIRLDGREMGRALMARLLGDDGRGDYVAPVELVERASLQTPGLSMSWDTIQPVPATPARDPLPDAAPVSPGPRSPRA